ncbi:MAG TPA: AAA family ATPase [Nocardioides sp.]|nr:AAA family ATPase [Nocardioides sp.]
MTVIRHVPTLKQVNLRHFSLYANVEDVSQEMRPASVFCLAGANGLGKSTFLAAVNFGFTGIVASPTRKFENFRQFYSESIEWSRTYFDGRVTEFDRDQAEVELHFDLGDTSYEIVRSLFEPTQLRRLRLQDRETGAVHFDAACDPDTGEGSEELHRRYADQILSDATLGDFAQFVFFQHFLLTFDERRHLLFWDEAATEPALYLAFGLSANASVRASDLRKRINKLESDARNAQWQATQALNRIKAFGIDVANTPTDMDLVAEHQSLVEAVDHATENKQAAAQAHADCRLELAEIAARRASLRAQYADLFTSQYEHKSAPSRHPVVRESVSTSTCAICGTESPSIAERIERALSSHQCPLCASEVSDAPVDTSAIHERLTQIDTQLADASVLVEAGADRLERLARELDDRARELEAAQKALGAFEAANAESVTALRPSPDSAIAAKIVQLQAERTDAQRRRDDHRRRRDEYKRELQPLQDELTAAYAQAESEFVPLFRELAFKFIGIDLDVFLRQSNTGLSLGLEVAGVRRRTTTQLSESQRFFLDIALRMALVEHMTKSSGGATLIIDTPEGSLDIAYEARAGELFAEFVKRSNQIVMTANINASQMLKTLAGTCRAQHMDLMRMTNWAPLSEVQAEAEDLFDEAYSAIEDALHGGDPVAQPVS